MIAEGHHAMRTMINVLVALTIAGGSTAARAAPAMTAHDAARRAVTAQMHSPANACAVDTKGGLTAVAASSARDVWATGGDNNTNKVVIEHWDGTCWRVVPAAAVSGTILGIAAISPHDAWAVGTIDAQSGSALIAHWDGVRWGVMPSPSTERRGQLYGVTAVSARDVWAVGTTDGQHGLIVHWDGKQWRVVPGSVMGALCGVAAVSARDVWAVGSAITVSRTGVTAVTATEHWDGSHWRRVPSPSLPGALNYLYAVAAVSAHDVWAAGSAGNAEGNFSPLLMHWDGVRWSKVRTVGFTSAIAVTAVTGLAAISAHNVWAAAVSMQHWDGTRWSSLPLAAPAKKALGAEAIGVAAVSTRDVWAVGLVAVSKTEFRTLTEHWDGARWRVVPS